MSVCPRLSKMNRACVGENAAPWHNPQPSLLTNKLAFYCSKETAETEPRDQTVFSQIKPFNAS